MRILVAFECSGAIRRELRALGHDAWSCDLKPAADGSEFHLQCDVRDALCYSWDAVLAIGPDCTYLTNSAEWAYKDPDYTRYPGVGYHQRLKPGTLFGAARREAREDAIRLVTSIWSCDFDVVAIENPVGTLSTRFREPHQIIHPHQFGDDASKATCLWLKGLPKLTPDPSLEIPPRWVCNTCGRVAGKARLSHCPAGVSCAGCGCACKPRWGNQTDSGQNNLAPSDARATVRGATYPGIATAMAQQWFGAAQTTLSGGVERRHAAKASELNNQHGVNKASVGIADVTVGVCSSRGIVRPAQTIL